jgi:hypothetical protein
VGKEETKGFDSIFGYGPDCGVESEETAVRNGAVTGGGDADLVKEGVEESVETTAGEDEGGEGLEGSEGINSSVKGVDGDEGDDVVEELEGEGVESMWHGY